MGKDISDSYAAKQEPLISPQELYRLCKDQSGKAVVTTLGQFPLESSFTAAYKAKKYYSLGDANSVLRETEEFDASKYQIEITYNRATEKQKNNGNNNNDNVQSRSEFKPPNLEEREAIFKKAQQKEQHRHKPELTPEQKQEIERRKERDRMKATLETRIRSLKNLKQSKLDIIKDVIPGDIYESVTTLDAKRAIKVIEAFFDSGAADDLLEAAWAELINIRVVCEDIFDNENSYGELAS
jgi:hypothetical protein